MLFVLCVHETSQGQFYYPDVRDTGAKYVIDTCRLVVTYDFRYVMDTVSMRQGCDLLALEIGHAANHYYSLYADRIDSMDYNYFVNIPRTDIARLESGINRTDWLGKDRKPWYFDVYTQTQQGKRTVSTRFNKLEYRYEEPVEDFAWTITGRSDTVAGYS